MKMSYPRVLQIQPVTSHFGDSHVALETVDYSRRRLGDSLFLHPNRCGIMATFVHADRADHQPAPCPHRGRRRPPRAPGGPSEVDAA